MTMEAEEEKIETPEVAAAPSPSAPEEVAAAPSPSQETVPVSEDAPAEEERKPTPMPKPKEPKIPLPSSLQEIVGALLFASQTPLTATDLRQCVRGVAPGEDDNAEVMAVYQSCTSREIEQAIHGLEKELERSGCGFRLVCAGGAYRLQTAPACGRYVRALLKLDRPNRLSRASLETLAIIAYRQPITKAEIEQIRGVAVDTIVKTLVDLQLVRLVGRSELPGHPFLYGTTPLFLEHFGLASLSELNAIDPTLQRSNPRERAKLFVKKEKPKPEEPAVEAAAADGGAAVPAAQQNAAADGDAAVPAAQEETAVVEGEVVESAEEETVVSVRFGELGSDDDDVFIDDTPDEFDDDDDDDDEDGESEGEDEDEELVDDDEDEEELEDDDEEEELEDEDEEEDDDEDA